jgi:CheY-like chemotaxis protein
VISESGDGDAAVELAQSLRPDVVLMDTQMPRRDGLAACRTLKAADRSTRVILYSAYESELFHARASNTGADLLLGKQDLFERSAIHFILLWPKTRPIRNRIQETSHDPALGSQAFNRPPIRWPATQSAATVTARRH